jgi:hypothetical protein
MGRIYDYKAKYLSLFRLRKDRRVFIKAKAYDEQQRMISDNRTLLIVLGTFLKQMLFSHVLRC